MSFVYLDTETTGLRGIDEVLQVAIIDDDGNTLLDTLVRPTQITEWPGAQEIHGISPENVADAPSLSEVQPLIDDAIRGKDVVVYNLQFDWRFVNLDAADSRHCAMEDFAEVYGQWNDYHKSYTWQKLTFAAKYCLHEWTGSAHNALADCHATRTVWRYMNDEEFAARVDREKDFLKEVKSLEREYRRSLKHKQERREKEADAMICRFLGIESFDQQLDWMGRPHGYQETDFYEDLFAAHTY